MSSPNSTPPSPWQDRRGIFQRGKEVHEPARKMSGSSGGSTAAIEAVRRASTSSQSDKSLVSNPLSNDPASPTSPTAARRRSSAASSTLFGNLTHHKRGSEDYADRRASQTEALGSGGAVGGWFNKTFRGIQSPAAAVVGQKQEKRGTEQTKQGEQEVNRPEARRDDSFYGQFY